MKRLLSRGDVLDFGDKTVSLQTYSVTLFVDGRNQSYKMNRSSNNLRRRPIDSPRFSHTSNIKLNDRSMENTQGTMNFMHKDTGAFGWKWWREVNGCQYPSLYQITIGLKTFYVNHIISKNRITKTRQA